MIRFSFDGGRFQGRQGDTLAAALLREGVHLMGRSFKYHRPRGVLAAGAEEPNALVEIDRGDGRRTPNLRATQVEIYEGMVARSQNRVPSLRFDIGAVNDLLGPLLPAGFYYKTFMWPASFWARWYEPAIRRAAGLGHTDFAPIIAALKDIEYSGYLSAEVLPLPDTDTAARQTIDTFRKFVK